MKKNNIELPECAIEIFKKEFETHPSETFVGNIKKDGIDILLKKNEVVWFKRMISSGIELYGEGLIKYGTNKLYIYFNKNEDESIYKLSILSVGKSDDATLKILINGLKQYLTII
jgi:hypothetical protein